jgi:hypothetical protein
MPSRVIGDDKKVDPKVEMGKLRRAEGYVFPETLNLEFIRDEGGDRANTGMEQQRDIHALMALNAVTAAGPRPDDGDKVRENVHQGARSGNDTPRYVRDRHIARRWSFKESAGLHIAE